MPRCYRPRRRHAGPGREAPRRPASMGPPRPCARPSTRSLTPPISPNMSASWRRCRPRSTSPRTRKRGPKAPACRWSGGRGGPGRAGSGTSDQPGRAAKNEHRPPTRRSARSRPSPAQGKINREIRRDPRGRNGRTAETYISRILNKLGFYLPPPDCHLGHRARAWSRK